MNVRNFLDIVEGRFDEARRNPDQNRKVETMDALRAYLGKNAFVSFTSDVGIASHKITSDTDGVRAKGASSRASGPKLGVNPRSPYDTPIGIYTYPIAYVLNKCIPDLPFASDMPFAYVITPRPGKTILDLSRYTQADLDRDITKMKAMGVDDETIDNGMKTAKLFTPAAQMWNITRLAAQDRGGKAPVKWNAILRSLGYDGFVDNGSGLIHHNEPTQALFLAFDVVQIEQLVHNKPASQTKPDVWAKKRDLFMSDLKAGRVTFEQFWLTIGKMTKGEVFSLMAAMPQDLKDASAKRPGDVLDLIRAANFRLNIPLMKQLLLRLLGPLSVETRHALSEFEKDIGVAIRAVLDEHGANHVVFNGQHWVFRKFENVTDVIDEMGGDRAQRLIRNRDNDYIEDFSRSELEAFYDRLPSDLSDAIEAEIAEHEMIPEWEKEHDEEFNPRFDTFRFIEWLHHDIYDELVTALEFGLQAGYDQDIQRVILESVKDYDFDNYIYGFFFEVGAFTDPVYMAIKTDDLSRHLFGTTTKREEFFYLLDEDLIAISLTRDPEPHLDFDTAVETLRQNLK